MKKRIWELDAARGLALIGMALIHLHYDVVELYGLWDWNPGWYPSRQSPEDTCQA